MLIFNRFINKLVAKEVAKRTEKEMADKRKELSAEFIKVQNEFQEKSNQEIQESQDKLKVKLAEVNLLADTYNLQIDALKKLRDKAEEEQKRLWDRLDILRDSLSADQVWSKLWALAYSKAVDVTWPILEKEIPHLVELAEQRAYLKARQEADDEYKLRLESLIKVAGNENVSKLKILALKQEIHEKMLIANRAKSVDNENKCLGKLELIDILIGDKP